MYNPLEQKLMFFVLSSLLLGQEICCSTNDAITFGKVDGKALDFDVSRLPSLRLLMLHAKHAIYDTREKIRMTQWGAPPNWDTLETLNSMMEDAAYRLCQDSDYVDQDSPEVFAQSAARYQAENPESVAKSLGNVRLRSSLCDDVFHIPPPPKSPSSASSGSHSSGKSRAMACEEFLARIESQSYVAKVAASQSAVASDSICSAVVAPSAVAAHASEWTRSSSFLTNLRPGSVQWQPALSSTARPGTTDPASAHPPAPPRPLFSVVASRGGLTTSPHVSSTAIMSGAPPCTDSYNADAAVASDRP
jgi:hypothetical protein